MSERDRKPTEAGVGRKDQSAAPAGASQFLVERLGSVGAQRYLQRKLMQRQAAASERAPAARMQAAAQAGTSGASTALPHLPTIQKSFGTHDVSQVKAHTDGAAAAGAEAMGAEAFATGDHVAFAGAPSLHTAAHEAAHVVQQRGGVQLKGGVGAAGDAHEQHADAVADRVVAGQSAEALLQPYDRAHAAPPSSGVQRMMRGAGGHAPAAAAPPSRTQQAFRAYDDAVDMAIERALNELGVEVSEEQVEEFFLSHYGVDDPRGPDFEIEDDEQLHMFLADVGSAGAEYVEHLEKQRDMPAEAYDRYGEIYDNKEKNQAKGKTLDREQLKLNTTASASFQPDGGMAHGAMLAQRSYPGMSDMAAEECMELHIAPKDLGNIHAEMLGLYKAMQATLNDELLYRMLDVHPSQSVCFFCEVMLRLFNVRYDETFVDKRMFAKWIDPTGYFEDEEGRYFTPASMLHECGLDVDEAVQRALPLFADVENPEVFLQRILSGHLQGQQLKKLIADLKGASATLAAANAHKGIGGASSTRGPSKNNKAGRKLLKQQREREKARKQQQTDGADMEIEDDEDEAEEASGPLGPLSYLVEVERSVARGAMHIVSGEERERYAAYIREHPDRAHPDFPI